MVRYDAEVEDSPTNLTAEDGGGRLGSWLVAIATVVAIAVRLPGLTTSNALFRDDAWLVLPVRVPISTAIHMGTTVPGFTLVLRALMGFSPTSSLLAQAIPFLASIAAPVVLWRLCQRYGASSLAAAVVAIVVTSSPVAIDYGVRVKSYSTEVLLACLLLVVVEWASRTATSKALWGFVAVALPCLFLSAATATTICGCVLGLWWLLGRAPATRRRLLGPTALLGLGGLLFLVGFYRHIPPSLHQFWQPFYLQLHSPHSMLHSSLTIVGGFSHGLTGLPGLFGHPTSAAVGALGVVLVAGLCVLGATELGGQGVTAVGVLFLAVLATIAQRIPLGTGRTDLVLYPAVAVLLAAGLDQVLKASWWPSTPRITLALGGAVGGVAMLGAALQPAWYPVQSLGTLTAQVEHLDRGTPLVVDAPNRYNWKLYQLGPAAVVLTQTNETGFTVEGRDPSTFIASSDPGDATYAPQRWARDISNRFGTHLWILGVTAGLVSPSDRRVAHPEVPHHSALYRALLADGWTPSRTVADDGVYATLLSRQSMVPVS